jgi:hypothetical protein
VCGISARNTKNVHNRYYYRNQNYAWWILARDTKVVRTSYWRDREVMHSGYRCEENDLYCGVVVHAKYGHIG